MFAVIIAIPITVAAVTKQNLTSRMVIKYSSHLAARVETRATKINVLKPAAWRLVARSKPIMVARTKASKTFKITA